MALCLNLCGDGALAPLNIIAISASDKAGTSSIVEQLMNWYDPVEEDGEEHDQMRLSSLEADIRAPRRHPPLPTVRAFEEYTFHAPIDELLAEKGTAASAILSKNKRKPVSSHEALPRGSAAASSAATAAVRVNITEIGRPLRGELHSSGGANRALALSDGAESQVSAGRTVGGMTTLTNTTLQDFGLQDTVMQDRRAFVKKLQVCDAVLFVVDASEVAAVGNNSLGTNRTARSDESSSITGGLERRRNVVSPSNVSSSLGSRHIGGGGQLDGDAAPITVGACREEIADEDERQHEHSNERDHPYNTGLSLPRDTPELILPNELSCGQVQLFLALRRCLAEMVEGTGLQAPTSTGIRSELNSSGGGGAGSFSSTTGGVGGTSIWSRRKVKYVKRKHYPLFYVVANKQDKPLALTAEQVALQLGLLASSAAATPQHANATATHPNAILKFDWLCEPAIGALHHRKDVARYGCTTFVERILAFREHSSANNQHQDPSSQKKGPQVDSAADTARALHKANSGARLLHNDTTSPPEVQRRVTDPIDVLPSPLAAVGPYLLAGDETVNNGSMCSTSAAGDSTLYSPPAAVEGRLLDPSKATLRRKSAAKRR